MQLYTKTTHKTEGFRKVENSLWIKSCQTNATKDAEVKILISKTTSSSKIVILLSFNNIIYYVNIMLGRFSCVRFFATPWTVAHQAPLFMGFSRQEYWSGLPFPTPGGLPHLGSEPASFTSPALAGRFFTTSTTWKAHVSIIVPIYTYIVFLYVPYNCISH